MTNKNERVSNLVLLVPIAWEEGRPRIVDEPSPKAPILLSLLRKTTNNEAYSNQELIAMFLDVALVALDGSDLAQVDMVGLEPGKCGRILACREKTPMAEGLRDWTYYEKHLLRLVDRLDSEFLVSFGDLGIGRWFTFRNEGVTESFQKTEGAETPFRCHYCGGSRLNARREGSTSVSGSHFCESVQVMKAVSSFAWPNNKRGNNA